jgi:hypothetical protein
MRDLYNYISFVCYFDFLVINKELNLSDTEEGANLLPLPLHFISYSPLLSSPSHSDFFFFGRCSLTRSTILAPQLCIRPSTFVLCHSSPPWSLLLFAGCVFVLNKSFLLHRSAIMDYL